MAPVVVQGINKSVKQLKWLIDWPLCQACVQPCKAPGTAGLQQTVWEGDCLELHLPIYPQAPECWDVIIPLESARTKFSQALGT